MMQLLPTSELGALSAAPLLLSPHREMMGSWHVVSLCVAFRGGSANPVSSPSAGVGPACKRGEPCSGSPPGPAPSCSKSLSHFPHLGSLSPFPEQGFYNGFNEQVLFLVKNFQLQFTCSITLS